MIFFLQMFVILAACRLCGWAVRRFLHQPQVIGEMIAGVILGPSLLGSLAPTVQQFLFPPESKPLLYAVAQAGIALYMFLVGIDFRSEDFRSNAKGALAISVSGIVVPFIVAIQTATAWRVSATSWTRMICTPCAIDESAAEMEPGTRSFGLSTLQS